MPYSGDFLVTSVFWLLAWEFVHRSKMQQRLLALLVGGSLVVAHSIVQHETAVAASTISSWERVDASNGNLAVTDTMASGLEVGISYTGNGTATTVYPPLRYFVDQSATVRFTFSSPVTHVRVLYSYVEGGDFQPVSTDQGPIQFSSGVGVTLVSHSVLLKDDGTEFSQPLGVFNGDPGDINGVNAINSGDPSAGTIELEFDVAVNHIEFGNSTLGGNIVGIELPAATVSVPSVTTGTVGQTYSSGAPSTSQFLPGSLTYSVSSGSLPAGLSIDPSTGVISGTPTAAGTQSVQITATRDGGGSATSESFDITIAKADQVITWSPATSLTLADSGLSLNATLTQGDGELGYAVVNQGTTECEVSGTTLVFHATGSGADGCEVRPTAAVSTNYNAKLDAATVTFDITRGVFAITSPSEKVGVSSSSFTSVCDSTCDVSGFAPADEILVVVSKSDSSGLSGRVKLTSTTGLTESLDGYQADATTADGYAELAFEGTQAEVNAALETLQYKSPVGGGDETISISASLAGAAYFSGTGHYYQVISGDDKTHADAITAAAARSFNGLNGYLATILSEEENRFIDGKISDRMVWIGGKYLSSSGQWEWVTGPASDQIAFWNGPTKTGSAITDVFSQWEPGQPDGSDICLATNYDGSDDDDLGNWDDLTCNYVKKWVVEYGGNGGTVLKEASTTFDVGAPTAPLQVNSVAAARGNTQITLSWSAPGDGGSAITDYLIEQSDDGGNSWTTVADGTSTVRSFTVTGLTNAVTYSFRISAINTVGTGSASETVSATPAAPTRSSSRDRSEDDASTETLLPTIPRSAGAPALSPRPAVDQSVAGQPEVLSLPIATPTSLSVPRGQVVSRVGGVLARVNSEVAADGGLSLSTSTWRMRLSLGSTATGQSAGADGQGLSFSPGSTASLRGDGLLPNTSVQVWLPSATNREFGRLLVNDNGEFDGEVLLPEQLGDTPLPIGPQTLQLTGYDSEGNQTVIDMAVNIAQGPPSPEPNRLVGEIPDLSPTQSLATSAGVPTSVVISTIFEQRLVQVEGSDWAMSLALDGEAELSGESDSPLIRMVQSGTGSVSGGGFQPGTIVSLWFFSEPTLAGTVNVEEDGTFQLDFLVDSRFIAAGEHTLQIQGVGSDGFIKAANLGVQIDEPLAPTTASAASMLLWSVLWAGLFLILAVMLVWALRRSRATTARLDG